jgi:hypothetical protein
MTLSESYSMNSPIEDFLNSIDSEKLAHEIRSLLQNIENLLQEEIPIEYLSKLVKLVNKGHLHRFVEGNSDNGIVFLSILKIVSAYVSVKGALPSKKIVFHIISEDKGKKKSHCSSAYGGDGQRMDKERSGGPRISKRPRHPQLPFSPPKTYAEQ